MGLLAAWLVATGLFGGRPAFLFVGLMLPQLLMAVVLWVGAGWIVRALGDIRAVVELRCAESVVARTRARGERAESEEPHEREDSLKREAVARHEAVRSDAPSHQRIQQSGETLRRSSTSTPPPDEWIAADRVEAGQAEPARPGQVEVGYPTHQQESRPDDRLRSAAIEAWERCLRREGRFYLGAIQDGLRDLGVDARVELGERLGLGETVIAVALAGGRFLLLPDFTRSPKALEKWFDYDGSSSRIARIEELRTLAIIRIERGSTTLESKGVVA